jgi:hypothetical protein
VLFCVAVPAQHADGSMDNVTVFFFVQTAGSSAYAGCAVQRRVPNWYLNSHSSFHFGNIS